jgi:murein DD-endopeptidase MepM/ murein hydrolase activator NlpD
MINQLSFDAMLENLSRDFHPIVPFNKQSDKVALLDLSKTNPLFTEKIYSDMDQFENFLESYRQQSGAKYLLGGYKEERQMYRRSVLFDKNISDIHRMVDEPRSIHLGVDIWGPAGTTVFAPLGGVVYGFAFNDHFGDYGATIILQHQSDATTFYTLYGHLSLQDIGSLKEGQFISRGQPFAHFGTKEENGHWPPHLHFQVIHDIGLNVSDYPGVCKPSESVFYLSNSPNPQPFIHHLFT